MSLRNSFSVKVLIAASMVVMIYIASLACATYIPGLSDDSHSFAQRNFVIKVFMLVFTGLLMLLLKNRIATDYGFKNTGSNYLLYLKKGVLYGLLGLFCLMVFNIVGFILTGQKPVGFPDERLVDRILFIWIWSSLVEEILFRGLIQSYLTTKPRALFTLKNAAISPQVFFSALFFSLLHLTVWSIDPNPFFVGGILTLTFILGMVAGYYREKTGSIWPAVAIHVLFNIVGSVPLLLKLLL